MTQLWWLGLTLALLSLAAVAQPFALPILAARRGSRRFAWWFIAGVAPVLAGWMVVSAGLSFGFDTVFHPPAPPDPMNPDHDLTVTLALLGTGALLLILIPSMVYAWCVAALPPPSKDTLQPRNKRAFARARTNPGRRVEARIGAKS